jgi:hypothetical protein
VGRAVRLDGDNCEEPAGFVKIMIAGEFHCDSTQAREPIASAIVDEFELGSPVFKHGQQQTVFAAKSLSTPGSVMAACSAIFRSEPLAYPCSANTTVAASRTCPRDC